MAGKRDIERLVIRIGAVTWRFENGDFFAAARTKRAHSNAIQRCCGPHRDRIAARLERWGPLSRCVYRAEHASPAIRVQQHAPGDVDDVDSERSLSQVSPRF